jgi:DNA modification methylase
MPFLNSLMPLEARRAGPGDLPLPAALDAAGAIPGGFSGRLTEGYEKYPRLTGVSLPAVAGRILGLRPPAAGAMLAGMDTDRIITGDCLDVLPTLPPGVADLVFADPPFNIGLDYPGYVDRLTREHYLAWTDLWLAEVPRVLSPAGSLFVQIADEWAGYLQVRLDALGLTWRNTIIWHYRFGPHQKRKFGRDHQQVLYYVADPERLTFNADDVRVRSARQEQGDKRADPKGRVPGDVWTFPRVCGTFRERRGHVCQTPKRVLERIVRVASNPGDLVLDPFAGTGTALAVARSLGRRYLGVELCGETADLARRRVETTTPPLPFS